MTKPLKEFIKYSVPAKNETGFSVTPPQCLDLTTEQASDEIIKMKNGVCSYCREVGEGDQCMVEVITDLITMTIPEKVGVSSSDYWKVYRARKRAMQIIEKEKKEAAERGCQHLDYQTSFTREMIASSRKK